jgi:hypothetical protein
LPRGAFREGLFGPVICHKYNNRTFRDSKLDRFVQNGVYSIEAPQ